MLLSVKKCPHLLRSKSHIFFIFLFILLFSFQVLYSPVGATNYSDNRNDLIRVGISTSDFKSLEYPTVSVSATGSFVIYDVSSNTLVAKGNDKTAYQISVSDKGFNITNNENILKSGLNGYLEVKTVDDNSYLILKSITRKGMTPSYRGKFEIVRANNSSSKLSVVNVLPLDEYLKGVVPNELPPSFGFEALKAQAVAARCYAIRPREKIYSQFDICDSEQCQVYFGKGTEHPLSNKAIEETLGLVGLYNGDVILALYSSTAGGFTEDYNNAFSDPQMQVFPGTPIPYLIGKPDVLGFNNLTNEQHAREFYMSSPPSYDVKSSYYRWQREYTTNELMVTFNRMLLELSKSSSYKKFISPEYTNKDSIRKIKSIQVLTRGISGKAMELAIQSDKGRWIVKKELTIRKLFSVNGKLLPSANIILNNYPDKDGFLSRLKIFGGGLGHGVGMSQYGASFMSQLGYQFDKILQRYYSGLSIGTIPVYLTSPNDRQLYYTQQFISPYSTGYLVLQKYGHVNSLKLKINDKIFALNHLDRYDNTLKLNISKYILKGINTIVYQTPESPEIAIKAWVEVIPPTEGY